MELQDKILNLLNENNSELKELYSSLESLRYANDYGYSDEDEDIRWTEDKIELIENKFKKVNLQLINSLIELNK